MPLPRPAPRRLVRSVGVACALACAAPPATARDMSGHLGVGGNVDSGPLGSGLSLRYWVSNLGLEVLFGFEAHHSTNDPALSAEDNAGYLEYRPAGRVLYNMTRTRHAHLYVGAGLAAVVRKSAFQGGPVAYVDAILGTELFFSDPPAKDQPYELTFSVSGQMILSFELSGGDPQRVLDTAGWGAAFHLYF